MVYTFHLMPNLSLLFEYGYLHATKEQVEEAVAKGQGVELEVRHIFNYQSQEEFLKAFIELLEGVDLQEHLHTILYISLLENELAYEHWFGALDSHKSRLGSVQLAKFLMTLHETSQSQAVSLKINTSLGSAKLTDSNAISWICGLIEKGLSNTDFTYKQLGVGGFYLLDRNKNRIKFGSPLDYKNVRKVANAKVRTPKTQEKKALAIFLHNVWLFLNQETSLTSAEGKTYSSRQMKFLFELAEIFGWLSSDTPERVNENYVYALFETHFPPEGSKKRPIKNP